MDRGAWRAVVHSVAKSLYILATKQLLIIIKGTVVDLRAVSLGKGESGLLKLQCVWGLAECTVSRPPWAILLSFSGE